MTLTLTVLLPDPDSDPDHGPDPDPDPEFRTKLKSHPSAQPKPAGCRVAPRMVRRPRSLRQSQRAARRLGELHSALGGVRTTAGVLDEPPISTTQQTPSTTQSATRRAPAHSGRSAYGSRREGRGHPYTVLQTQTEPWITPCCNQTYKDRDSATPTIDTPNAPTQPHKCPPPPPPQPQPQPHTNPPTEFSHPWRSAHASRCRGRTPTPPAEPS